MPYHPLPQSDRLPSPPQFNQPNQQQQHQQQHQHQQQRRTSAEQTIESQPSSSSEYYETSNNNNNNLSPSTTHILTPSPSSTLSSSSPTLNQQKNRSRDSYANTYGHSGIASGPDISSLSAIASGLVGGDYGPFPQELSHPGGYLHTIHEDYPQMIFSPISHTNHHLKSRRPPSADGYSGSVRDSLVSYDDSGLGHVYGPLLYPLRSPGSVRVIPLDSQKPQKIYYGKNRIKNPTISYTIRIQISILNQIANLSLVEKRMDELSGLIGLFALYPILTYVLKRGPTALGWNIGGVNGTGQFPDIPNLPRLIDLTTPDNVKSRTAVDLHYWQTTNFEWYDPDAVTTKDGKLVIQIDQEPNHNLRARSGMIQSWNKFCFTEGYIEVNISLPGAPGVQGFWPGAWTMGNLARAGFGASNEGMWPYSYEACDVGTLPNQTMPDGRTPPAAKTSGSPDYGGALSWLPGQRTSACTCKGEDHPGPSVDIGRSGPEIDILEAQYAYGPNGNQGSMSQSIQIAPMDEGYQWLNDSSGMRESLSGITMTDGTSYEDKGYQQFGFEYNKGFQADGGRVSWTYGGQETWTIFANAIAGQSGTQVSPRPISTEPMYVILNLGISNKFQTVEWEKLKFPAKMYVDYVRIYQREGHTNIGCSPKDRPTEDYINRHLGAYTNPNFTTWAQAGYTVPKNRLKDNC
ncbi:hypothetical protein H4Q26_011582 [Puccinia striiformis f. sp. tritici PST-130]|nr:hypothetical protein H4Q26_011582 [Puccinia striiformis f. sp. tritici PST-130]